MDASRTRFAALVAAAGLDLVGGPELMTSHSNDTWYVRSTSAGEAVLRVCWIGDRERMLREAAVGRALPREVGYPEVLASGALTVEGEPVTWMISRRLAGQRRCGRSGPSWTSGSATARCARWRDRCGPCTPGARPRPWLLDWVHPPRASSRQTIIGSTILPLPLDRVRHLVAPAADRAGEHRAVVEESWGWLVDHADLLPRLDDPADAVTHGDLHLDNIWWDGERVTGLLDLEWVRRGPAWIDLVSVRDNALAGDEFSEPHQRLLDTLRAEVPGLEAPDLVRRLTVVELAFQLRQILVWPPPGPDPAVDHPIRLLGRLLDAV